MSQSSARNSDTASTKTVISNRTCLIHGDQALADAINAGLSTVRTWRAKRLIPYIKTGHKSVIYDLSKVLAALGTLEVKPVTGKGER